jgi:hypothetical protein
MLLSSHLIADLRLANYDALGPDELSMLRYVSFAFHEINCNHLKTLGGSTNQGL